ncbi:MAG: hydrogenase expression/formation protein HypE [Gemmatimonadetes bacterium]|nr:hydrogenase expression/formation protein HypE [Gemmatimonadota bacterium]
MSAAIVAERFWPKLQNSALGQFADASLITVAGAELAVSTDSFVVQPLEFPGGNIGSLAVHGTLNDIAMMGARPVCLTAAFVLEEGLPFDLLDRVIDAMARASAEAGVPVIAGDTKVVERGKADGLYINTTGIGVLDGALRPAPGRATVGDAILVSGPIARHGMAVMAQREGLAFESAITSDSACLMPLVEQLRGLGSAVHVMRDPTRGGVASALNEIAQASNVGVEIEEGALPVPDDVRAACEMLGLDPLFVANEGVLVAFVDAAVRHRALDLLRAHPLGAGATAIGVVVAEHPRMVALRTGFGGTRVVDMLPGDQLPRIC